MQRIMLTTTSGLSTFHGMGMVAVVTFGTKHSRTVPRNTVTPNEILACVAGIIGEEGGRGGRCKGGGKNVEAFHPHFSRLPRRLNLISWKGRPGRRTWRSNIRKWLLYKWKIPRLTWTSYGKRLVKAHAWHTLNSLFFPL